jgi:translation initiation factor 1
MLWVSAFTIPWSHNLKKKKMDIKMSASHPVYSTDSGRICPACGKPISNCACKTKGPPPSPGDGIIRIRREVKGRRGKTVTIVCGFESDIGEIKKLAVQLKRLCGTGGSVKDGEIIIQGDHREAIKKKLEQLAFRVKLAGG